MARVDEDLAIRHPRRVVMWSSATSWSYGISGPVSGMGSRGRVRRTSSGEYRSETEQAERRLRSHFSKISSRAAVVAEEPEALAAGSGLSHHCAQCHGRCERGIGFRTCATRTGCTAGPGNH